MLWQSVLITQWWLHPNFRGISRALVGDASGAIEDFLAYIDWATKKDAEKNKAAIAERKQWIATLQGGSQPFSSDVLKALGEMEQQAEQ